MGLGLIRLQVWISPLKNMRFTSDKIYRSDVYRRVYGAAAVGVYLLLMAYRYFEEDLASDNSDGVWRLLLGMALAGALGALVGPRLHRRLFGLRVPSRSAPRSRHHGKSR